jgi:hypothetical protein
MKNALLILVIPLILLAGCSSGASEANGSQQPLNQEFTLQIGQSVAITGEDLSIKFDAITEDSRCPSGVVCVWAGRVTIQLIVTTEATPRVLLVSETGSTGDYTRIKYDQYQFDFRIEPYPEAGQSIDPSDYRLFFKVSL